MIRSITRAAGIAQYSLGQGSCKQRLLLLAQPSRRFTDSHDDFKPKKTEIATEMKDVLGLIEKQVKEHDVLLFMKGTPSQPQCGFSLQTVRILNAVGANFSSINVLEYPAIREGVKLYSEWPTIPQLYIKGEFIGGCDIVTNLYKEGELEKILKEKDLIPKA